ncbi:putative cytochrome P450 [Helianthus debilis subsp. tardiflorus]|nr:putative cytochrome P450 [Helianthus annuus]
MTSHHHLQMIAHIRVSEVQSSLMDIYRTWVTNKGSSETVMVDMKQWFGSIVINMVVRMMFGNHFSPGQQNRDQFQKAIKQFGGYEKKMKKTAKEIDVVINGWLEDHKRKMNSTSTQHADNSRDQTVFMAALLSAVKEEVKEEVYGFSTDEIVKATCLAIYGAATDTTTATLTWALALLVNHPVVLKKAQHRA